MGSSPATKRTRGIASVRVAGFVACVGAVAGCGVFGAGTSDLPMLVRTQLGSPALGTDSRGADRMAATTLPINGRPFVIASRRIQPPRAGEVLEVDSDFELSDNVVAFPLGQRVDVTVRVSLVLAGGATTPNGTVIGSQEAAIPWRVHHLTFTPSARGRVPAALARRTLYVNEVGTASVSHPPALCVNPDTGLVIGCAVTVESKDDQLGVLLLPARSARLRVRSYPVASAQLPSPRYRQAGYGRRRVVWASPPMSFSQGDVIVASASLRASVGELERGLSSPAAALTGCNALLSGELYLSESPHALVGTSLPALSGDTGFNLTWAQPNARWHELGFWQSSDSYGRRFLDLVMWSSRSSDCPARPVQILAPGSSVTVSIYRR